MKNSDKYFTLAVFLFIATVFAADCSKQNSPTSNTSPPPQADTTIIGSWDWILTTGGFGGVHITPALAGYKTKSTFRSDSSFAFYRNDTLLTSTTFSTKKVLPTGARDSISLLYYGDQPPSQVPQQISFQGHDTLGLSGYNIKDGFNYTYVRIK